MDEADMNSGVSQLGIEEERILASFSRRLIKIAVVACGREAGAFATNALNRIRLPAIILDRRGFVVEVNAAAGAVFDPDINIKDNRFCVRDLKARALLKVSLDEMTKPVKLESLIAEPIIVQRHGKLPLILRILPFKAPPQSPEQFVS
jgi:hypothetical protein